MDGGHTVRAGGRQQDVRARVRAAGKALKGDETHTHTHTHDGSNDTTII